MALGFLFAFFAGAAQPVSTLVFGEITNAFQKWGAQSAPGVLISTDDLLQKVSRGSIFFIIIAGKCLSLSKA